MITSVRVPTSPKRAASQRGNEIIEFALLSIFLVPLFLWTFLGGMNLLRMIQTNEICRDIGNLYIHGVDYSTYPAQTVAARLAQGYGLQIGSGFNGNDATNDANGGKGYVVLSQIMYVGSASCSSLPPGVGCTNEFKYVFLQRIDFGNKSLQFSGKGVSSATGNPTAVVNSAGFVQNYLTDAGAVAPSFGNFLQTQLADGQAIYVVETFFASPDLNFSAFPGGGLYNRTFF